ncbi:MAG: hypothetical protein RLZZ74_1098, partial [Cyanobacteriota bacterium]
PAALQHFYIISAIIGNIGFVVTAGQKCQIWELPNTRVIRNYLTLLACQAGFPVLIAHFQYDLTINKICF